MRMPPGSLLLVPVLASLPAPLWSAPDDPLAQGATPCSAYMELVDGNWSHPLNALNFHGYVSWAMGRLDATASDLSPRPTTEDVKLWLADHCRAHPEQSFRSAVEAYLAARRGP